MGKRGEHREEARDGHDQHVAVRDVRQLVCEHALDLFRLEALPEAGGDADGGMLRRAAGRERVRDGRVHDRDLRLRQVGHRAEPLDHVVQRRLLLAADDLRAGRPERELVRRVVLEERERDDDHEHRCEPDAEGLQEDEPEDHVEQAEHARRQEHPQREAGVAAVRLPFHGRHCRPGTALPTCT